MKKRKIIAVDLFAGAGGTSTGILAAAKKSGLDIDLTAVNHWKTAINSHALNHPKVKHLCENVEAISPATVVPGRVLHLLAASCECFPAGTLVLTSAGYVPIENIRVGDYVLTHKNRWRAVTSVMSKVSDTVVVKGQGHWGLETTAEHPFYIRERKAKHRRSESDMWSYSEPVWKTSKELKFNNRTLWATPTTVPPVCFMDMFGFDERFFEIVGWWLAEGGVTLRTNSLVWFSVGKHEKQKFDTLLNGRNKVWKSRDVRTATIFEAVDNNLANWLVENFGKLAGGKKLPAWVYGMKLSWRKALLKGYCEGDGCIMRENSNSPKQSISTISKELAFGIKLLASSLGYRTSINLHKERTIKIEGRTVKCKVIYEVCWTINPQRLNGLQDGDHYWTLLKRVKTTGVKKEVINLSVDQDESYVAEGIVVHNCTFHSNARGGGPCNEQSRAQPWQIIRWVGDLDVHKIFMENVPEFVNWTDLVYMEPPLKRKPGWYPNPKTKGAYFNNFIDQLKKMGYQVEWRIQNAADFGDGTKRRRWIMLASKYGPVVWPKESHGEGRRHPHKTARKHVIDWSLEGQSIFNRKKPLSENTIRRIAAGLTKFGGKAAEPFLVMLYGTGVATSVDQPLPSVAAGGMHHGLAEPFIVNLKGQSKAMSVDEPAPTQTAHARHLALAEPTAMMIGQQSAAQAKSVDDQVPTVAGAGAIALVQPKVKPFITHTTHRGKRPQHSVEQPLPTVTGAHRGEMALVDPQTKPFILEQFSGRTPKSVDKPLGVITTDGGPAVVEPQIKPFMVPTNFGERSGQAPRTEDIDKPLNTVVGAGNQALVQPILVTVNHGKDPKKRGTDSRRAKSVDEPLGTITSAPGIALCEPCIVQTDQTGSNGGCVSSVDDPIKTIVSKQNQGLVEPFLLPPEGFYRGNVAKTIDGPITTITGVHGAGHLVDPYIVKFYGTGTAVSVDQPLDTVTTKDRFLLIEPKTNRVLAELDIRFRMLQPHELAAAHSFPKNYRFTGNKGEQTKQIGNSVPCKLSESHAKVLMVNFQ